jgi:hypothetical protein
MKLSRIGGAIQALAINAVSIGGVFGLGWPVGTAIALYWAENVLRGVLTLAVLIAWHFLRQKGPHQTTHVFMDFSLKQFLGFGIAFNVVHAIFLAVILGFLVPRMAPAQRFQAVSFREGIIWIALFLAIELVVWVVTWRRVTFPGVQRAAEIYMRRVVVVHLTIVFGMFGLVLFDRPTVLFATFATLKTAVEFGGYFHRGTGGTKPNEVTQG